MRRINIDDEKSAIAYLEGVLTNWDSWQGHHLYLVKALKILLHSYRFKCESMDEMAKYISELHRAIEALERVRKGEIKDEKDTNLI